MCKNEDMHSSRGDEHDLAGGFVTYLYIGPQSIGHFYLGWLQPTVVLWGKALFSMLSSACR